MSTLDTALSRLLHAGYEARIWRQDDGRITVSLQTHTGKGAGVSGDQSPEELLELAAATVEGEAITERLFPSRPDRVPAPEPRVRSAEARECFGFAPIKEVSVRE